MSDVRKVAGVLTMALHRMELGKKKYGEFYPDSDERDLFSEMEEELMDTINYAAMQILKIREMRGKFAMNLAATTMVAEVEPCG
jgi:hypothetical protein